jgi:hypothetical protein
MAPPEQRPSCHAGVGGDELLVEADGVRRMFRQVGWHGHSGTFYALGENPALYESGAFAPLWILVYAEPLDERMREAVTQVGPEVEVSSYVNRQPEGVTYGRGAGDPADDDRWRHVAGEPVAASEHAATDGNTRTA